MREQQHGYLNAPFPSFLPLWILTGALIISPSIVSADVILSEIMYHPLPFSESDESEKGEYIELYNSGTDTVQLEGYHFDRGITFAFPANATLPAKSYLLLLKDPEAFPNLANLRSTYSGYTGSLSNSGETLRLKDALDQTVFSIRYGSTGDWPAAPDGTGHSLVYIDRDGDPNSARNWGASRTRHGTPGGPELMDNSSLGMTRNLIKKGTPGRYFKGTKEPSNGDTSWTQPEFTPNSDWLSGPSGYGYSNNTSELAPISTRLNDMRGNYLSLYVRIPFELAQEEIDRLETLTLTMHYDDSYVVYLNGTRVTAEGVNGSPPAFDQISNAGNDYAPITTNISQHRDRLAGGHNVLAIQGDNIGLNNSSDFVLGPELDLTIAPQPTAQENARKVRINELQTNATSTPDLVEFFNPTDEVIDLSGMWLSDKSENLTIHQIPVGTTVAPDDFLTIPLSVEMTGFAISSLGDQIFLTTEDLESVIAAYAFGPQELDTSIGRFPDGGTDWYRSQTPSPGAANNRAKTSPVAISEIMYNDPMSQANEYIELRNLTPNAIDISDWEFNGVQFNFPSETLLPSSQSFLIADNAQALLSTYGISRDLILGEYGGSLSNRGERLRLLDAFDIVVDSVRYDDAFPWPITPDGLGSSLERNCFQLNFDQPSDWSASPLNRPSPGARNNIESCQEASPSPVQISEFLYHPATRTTDDRATEFIEIINMGSTRISLSGWAIAGDVFYVFPENAAIPPNQALLLAWDPVTLTTTRNLDASVVFGPYLGELPNGGGEILLVQSDGRLADRVRYNDDFPWPSLADGGDTDRSLQRFCFDDAGDAPANWFATDNPTPGQISVPDGECTTPTRVVKTETLPALVTRQTRPVVTAEFSGPSPTSVSIRFWVDDPEMTGEPQDTLAMNNQGLDGDQTADDSIWSTTLPAFPNNSIVRYLLQYTSEMETNLSPDSTQDAFASHAYFVDPLADSNLPNNYHLFVSSANWQKLHTATQPGRVTRGRANPNWNDEVPAVFVAEGVVHDVSVRHQGSRWNRKNGSTISFDCESHQNGSAQVRSWRVEFPSHRNHDGMDVILLQKQSGWPQHISFKMFEQAGVPAPRTSWAKLRINGCDYNNDAFQIERPGRDLVARWFNEVGDLFKSQGFTGDEGPWSWGDARLIRGSRNGSSEQERYEHTYNRKTLGWRNDPFDGIQDAPETMIEGLHRARGQGTAALRQWLAENFDVDQTLRYICTINYVGTFDDMFQNHYLYKKADSGKWCMFPWDMDNTLGGAFGETSANPFRGVNESRHGNVGNRSGWWNRIKDSFFIAYEAEFLEMFHRLNNTVHAPAALESIVQEGATMRGLSQGSVDSLIRHMTRRHDYLNNYIQPRLAQPGLSLTRSAQGISLEWPSHRTDYRLEQAASPDGPWISTSMTEESPLNFSPTEATRFFRLIANP